MTGRRRHYQTEEEAIPGLWEEFGEITGQCSAGWTAYHYVAGILTIAVPFGFVDEEPRILLRENEGLYWEVPDA